jgi:hypothetical protein
MTAPDNDALRELLYDIGIWLEGYADGTEDSTPFEKGAAEFCALIDSILGPAEPSNDPEF